MRLSGLDPIITSSSEALILGTFPGPESLKRRQYYADSRNKFWSLLEEIIGIHESRPYEDRRCGLIARRLALWDVIGSCSRDGALDRDIREKEPTDLGQLLREYPNVRVLLFNGGGARDCFFEFKSVGRLMLPKGRTLDLLPSSSGTNTHMTVEQKVAAWKGKFASLRL